MRQGNSVPNNPLLPMSGIRDNYQRGNVGDFLKARIQEGSTLSIVSAYFTIYAYEALKQHLTDIESLNFLFGEPRFVKSLDPDRTDKKAFKIEDDTLELANRLQQKRIAEECARWIQDDGGLIFYLIVGGVRFLMAMQILLTLLSSMTYSNTGGQ